MWDDPTTFSQLQGAFERQDYHVVVESTDAVLLTGTCEPGLIGRALLMKCQAALYTGQPAVAIVAGEQALTWAEKQSDWDLEGLARLNLGCALVLVGRVADGAQLFEGYFAHKDHYTEALGHEALARFNLGVAYRHTGRITEAIEQYRTALALYEQQRNQEMAMTVRDNLAWALMLQRDAQAAREQLEAMKAYVSQRLDLTRLQSLLVDLAAYHLLKGETQEARDICRDLVQALDERDRACHLAMTYVILGRIELQEGRLDETRRLAQEARHYAEIAERWDLHNEATNLLLQCATRKEEIR